jgi:hypothetical protein
MIIYEILRAIYVQNKGSVITGTDTHWDSDVCKIALTANSSYFAVLLNILQFKQEYKHVQILVQYISDICTI